MAKKQLIARKTALALSRSIPKALDTYLVRQQVKAAELAELLRLLDQTNECEGYAIGLARRLATELKEALDTVACEKVLLAHQQDEATAS